MELVEIKSHQLYYGKLDFQTMDQLHSDFDMSFFENQANITRIFATDRQTLGSDKYHELKV